MKGRRELARYLSRRIGWSIVVLLAASVILFVSVRATTDPLSGLRASQSAGTDVDSEAGGRVIEAERARLGLDRPLVAQYGHWLSAFVRGDWGQSIASRRSVGLEIRAKLWNTVQLIAWGIILSVALAVAVGVVSGARQYSMVDHTLSGLSFVALSMPSFWFGLMAIELFVFLPKQAFHLEQPLLYSVGLHSAGGGPLDYVRHLVLPVMTLSLPLVATWSRYVRSSMLDVLSAPYIRAAAAKGVPRRRVLFDHALRNALIPFSTVSAVGIGQLLGGLIITETIFAWPGMGQLLFGALQAGDTNVLLPWLVVVAGFALALNLLADILNGVLDPRARV